MSYARISGRRRGLVLPDAEELGIRKEEQEQE